MKGIFSMRTTIKVIAERAGVSIGTVDRVLHNRPYVKEEVRAHVLQVLEEMDYHPNRMASALATSGTLRHLALIQPEWTKGYVADEMKAGTARFLEECRDYNVTLDVRTYPQEDDARCLQLLEEAVEGGAQAVALCATGTAEIRAAMERLAERNIPVITFNSDVPGGRRLCYVGEDGLRAGRVAGEIASRFLTATDHFLVICAEQVYSAHKARVEGFLERLTERGIPAGNGRITATHWDYQRTADAVENALEAYPDLKVVYMANPSETACAEVLRSRGLTGKVHVISHDNAPEIRELLREGRVDFTIGQDLAYQPYQSLKLLFEALTGRLPQQDCYTATPILNAEIV